MAERIPNIPANLMRRIAQMKNPTMDWRIFKAAADQEEEGNRQRREEQKHQDEQNKRNKKP